MQVIEAGDFEIERRLESYARARLSPDPLTIARVRARVMREARLQADQPRIAVLVPSTARRVRRRVRRRLSMAILAAAVWLGVAAGSIFAAQAGGPLYPARMWLEQATLPADPAARAGAELTRLEGRLADALAAAARGDSGAVQAALDAYGAIADETIAATSGNATLESIVTAALDRHLAVLGEVAARLADKGNATAVDAVEASIARAIEHNQNVIDRLESATPAAGGAGASGAGAGGAGGGTGAGGAQPTDKETDEPKSTKSPKPTATATVKPAQEATPNKPTPEPTVKPTPNATSRATPPQNAPRGNGDN